MTAATFAVRKRRPPVVRRAAAPKSNEPYICPYGYAHVPNTETVAALQEGVLGKPFAGRISASATGMSRVFSNFAEWKKSLDA
ncbi:MAG: hypothetical protein LBP75_05010 [Planctomycetota bacterium]|jgi:hypothetical protein|nr:hypothetical protein [Planctomycetota bacterium]